MQYRFKTFCNMNPGADSILCRLKFGTWSYPENELSLQVGFPVRYLQWDPYIGRNFKMNIYPTTTGFNFFSGIYSSYRSVNSFPFSLTINLYCFSSITIDLSCILSLLQREWIHHPTYQITTGIWNAQRPRKLCVNIPAVPMGNMVSQW